MQIQVHVGGGGNGVCLCVRGGGGLRLDHDNFVPNVHGTAQATIAEVERYFRLGDALDVATIEAVVSDAGCNVAFSCVRC